MRIWHTDLIKVLPREQLISQWRECSSIAGAIQKMALLIIFSLILCLIMILIILFPMLIMFARK